MCFGGWDTGIGDADAHCVHATEVSGQLAGICSLLSQRSQDQTQVALEFSAGSFTISPALKSSRNAMHGWTCLYFTACELEVSLGYTMRPCMSRKPKPGAGDETAGNRCDFI